MRDTRFIRRQIQDLEAILADPKVPEHCCGSCAHGDTADCDVNPLQAIPSKAIARERLAKLRELEAG